MRPFPGKQLGPSERIYYYRLSRARRIVENAFGILAARFRVFHRTMDQRPQTVDKNCHSNLRSSQPAADGNMFSG